MIEFTTFDVKTRRLLGTMKATTIDVVDQQCAGDVDYVLGWHRPVADFYVDAEGQVRPIADADAAELPALAPPKD